MKKIALMILTLGVALGGLVLTAEARGYGMGGGPGYGGCPGWRAVSAGSGSAYGRGYGPGNCPAYSQGYGSTSRGAAGYGPGYGGMMYGGDPATPNTVPASPATPAPTGK